jgi:hypothetical protein
MRPSCIGLLFNGYICMYLDTHFHTVYACMYSSEEFSLVLSYPILVHACMQAIHLQQACKGLFSVACPAGCQSASFGAKVASHSPRFFRSSIPGFLGSRNLRVKRAYPMTQHPGVFCSSISGFLRAPGT